MKNPWSCDLCWEIEYKNIIFERTWLRQTKESFYCKLCGSALSFDFDRSKVANEPENKLLIINWPFCSDKWLVWDSLAQDYGFIHISGYEILKEKRKKNKSLTYNDIHADILRLSHKLLLLWKKVVLTQTILPSFWLLYEYYFKEYSIDSNMVVLLPELENIYIKNNQLIHSFDEEFLEEMYCLFLEEKDWFSLMYQYEDGIVPEIIAKNLSNYFYPKIQTVGLLQTYFDNIKSIKNKNDYFFSMGHTKTIEENYL